MKKINVFVVGLLFLLGCATVQKTSKSASNGAKELYEKKCSTCHALHKPSAFTASEWVGIMDMCAENAGLTKEEKTFILDWVSKKSKPK